MDRKILFLSKKLQLSMHSNVEYLMELFKKLICCWVSEPLTLENINETFKQRFSETNYEKLLCNLPIVYESSMSKFMFVVIYNPELISKYLSFTTLNINYQTISGITSAHLYAQYGQNMSFFKQVLSHPEINLGLKTTTSKLNVLQTCVRFWNVYMLYYFCLIPNFTFEEVDHWELLCRSLENHNFYMFNLLVQNYNINIWIGDPEYCNIIPKMYDFFYIHYIPRDLQLKLFMIVNQAMQRDIYWAILSSRTIPRLGQRSFICKLPRELIKMVVKIF